MCKCKCTASRPAIFFSLKKITRARVSLIILTGIYSYPCAVKLCAGKEKIIPWRERQGIQGVVAEEPDTSMLYNIPKLKSHPHRGTHCAITLTHVQKLLHHGEAHEEADKRAYVREQRQYQARRRRISHKEEKAKVRACRKHGVRPMCMPPYFRF